MGCNSSDYIRSGPTGDGMQINADWLNAASTQKVLSVLGSAGHQAFIVGGCVRNALFNVPVNDIDISTDATPDQVIEIAQNAGIRAVPTGIDHGTVTLITDDNPIEVTTFRKDVATDGRRAVVEFSDNIKDDALRRDFTVNALYATASGEVIDPLGGLQDINPRRIRFIQDAQRRIQEDYLRIIRFFRFFALYGDQNIGLDPDGLAACASNIDGIAQLSKERLGSEMRKLLSANDPAPTLGAMAASGVLAQVIVGAEHKFVAPLVHLEQEANLTPKWIRRLAIMGGENLTKALRLSKSETKTLKAIRTAMGRNLGENAYRYGADIATDALLIECATLGNPLSENYQEKITKGANAEFPVTAADLMSKFESGPELGAELKRLESEWIASGFEVGKTELLDS